MTVNDMLRFENKDRPRLVVLVAGDRLSEELVRAVEEWVEAHPETSGYVEFQARQIRDLSPAGIAALLDEHFGA